MSRNRRLRATYVVVDWISTNCALLLYNLLRYFIVVRLHSPNLSLSDWLLSSTLVSEQVIFPLVMLAIYGISGYYNEVYIKSRVSELLNTASTAAVGTIILFIAVLVNDLEPARRFFFELVGTLYLCLFVVVYIPRLLMTGRASRLVRNGSRALNTLIVGTGKSAAVIEERLRNRRYRMGLRIVGFVSTGSADQPHSDLPHPVYPMSGIADVCRELNVERIIVSPHRNGMAATTQTVNSLLDLGIHILITPDVHLLLSTKTHQMNVASELLVDITRTHMPASSQNLKRLGDVICSAAALVLLSPLFAVLAVLIKRDSPGPVIYSQERIGRHKKPFRIYKFRSMTVEAEHAGPALSSAEDPRITRVGRVLRKYRLDELPQFWNVLRGDMSLVGPRPERAYYIDQLVRRAPHYTIVQQMRPGITSWGMVKYGYASNIEQMLERLPYDILYIENASFVIDLKILLYTVRTVFTGKGI